MPYGCFSLVLASLVVAVTMFFGGCVPERPACAPEALAKIEAAYIAEAVQACQGSTFETCPALPGIREKYRAKRAEWETCE